MNETGTHKIRPAGRLILTIGRELIQDPYAAVVELVKNSYDADSPDVSIEFRGLSEGGIYCFTIADHGHGMTRDDVINKWLVPSTANKRKIHLSPSGRVMQGRKGIGRYAASILGKDLFLESVTVKGEKTEAYIEWKEFEESEYLEDVEILVETSVTSELPGTRLTVNGDFESSEWNQKQFEKLRFELRRLKSPVELSLNDDDFHLRLEVSGFPDVEDVSETIVPYPIFSLFDYKISGKVDAEGKGSLEYSMQKIRNSPVETILFEYGRPTECGGMQLDIRVYDRDSASISSLIGRGLKDDFGNYLGNLKARQLLNEYNGIGVFRNGFRIRPLGDPDFDWLKLNERRVQNPSLRIGSNQVIGFVQIQPEEQSGLTEKSARDGLRDNRAFDSLKNITRKVIAELEIRRFSYRRKTGLKGPSAKVGRDLARLFSFEELNYDVQNRLIQSGYPKEATEEILEIIRRDEEERNKVANDIRQTVAIYQGQATLGKIVNVILHEGRRPLSYFRNAIPSLRYWHKSFLKTGDFKDLDEALVVVDRVSDNAEHIVVLFGRIDPLAAGKRGPKRMLSLKKEISGAFSIFTDTLESQRVVSCIKCSSAFMYSGWSQDFYTIFTNLIDNSLYWMEEKGSPTRQISVDVVVEQKSTLHIDYRDTGPGIDPELIASEVIFEPQFSTKPSGTGIGLPIAGEAAARNGLELRAVKSDTGAWFRLQTVEKDGE